VGDGALCGTHHPYARCSGLRFHSIQPTPVRPSVVATLTQARAN
jgi:hypothetical protein